MKTMANTNILDLGYPIFTEIQNILDNPGSMKSFLEVLPPDCTSENVLLSMELEGRKYNNTPAKVLLTLLGSKGYGILNLIEWFKVIKFEKALVLLRTDEHLRIVRQPVKNVVVNEGGVIILSCLAVSYPPPEYQWYRDDVELLLQVDSTLTIKCASENDSGNYTCLVTKLDRKANCIEYKYSDHSTVQVVQSCLHVTTSHYPELQPSAPNVVRNLQLLPIKKKKSSSISDLDSGISSFSKENSRALSIKSYEVLDVEPSKKEVISISKQPYVYGKVPQGMSVCLTCEASSSSQTVNYQWIKNGKPLPGETSFQLILYNLYPDPETGEKKSWYQCVLSNQHDQVFSDTVTVELKDANESTPFMAQQKYAFLVANSEYEHSENLKTPAADVRDLANILSSLGFKILALKNLTLTAMKNALRVFCNALVPGCYALFFFAGHGFDSCGQTYLQPVDCSDRPLPQESMCLEFVLESFQQKKTAINILLVDACRRLSSRSSHREVFEARMNRNTIYGYSTSFLGSSHELDEDENSIYVKYLKKYILQNKSIQDILLAVHGEFAKDPLVKDIQFPGIKTTLFENRKFSDPVQESSLPDEVTDLINWCDVKRAKLFYHTERNPILNCTLEVEFDQHMGTFCNGIDISVFLQLAEDADLSLLRQMAIGLNLSLPELCNPVSSIDLGDLLPEELLCGKRNFLFKEEVFNVQKFTDPCLRGDIAVMLHSQIVKNYKFAVDLSKFVKLQLSVNDLRSRTAEDSRNCTRIKKSFR